jgi:hypothetical protein
METSNGINPFQSNTSFRMMLSLGKLSRYLTMLVPTAWVSSNPTGIKVEETTRPISKGPLLNFLVGGAKTSVATRALPECAPIAGKALPQ